ncbi:lytic transglycosylase domain-containing protein [Salmonella enterica]|nr:lytic transglycosylase domain-containing protein [Salmonella enterica]EDY5469228.1 lytic transglycosylase domain-containing protein [Salmonella enterica]EGJ4209876.1 lytic transglycosylase domain-containing protein [Salmonella enterica]EHK2397406.1 lytic transglycosylase domain-containing protein [Salmonella enterica]EIK6321001.1 lytic transglycosylase domain-containing protein [Salmonella enterica]
MLSTTTFLSLAMHCAAAIHPDTSAIIARAESGFNPYAIAEIRPAREHPSGPGHVISHLPDTRNAALHIISRIKSEGRRYSVGLMQITSTNFKHYGVTARDLLDPCINLSVYEKILTDCYQRGGTLKRALSCYYSGNFDTGQQPETAFNGTSYLQRTGYSPVATQYTVPAPRDNHTLSPHSLQNSPAAAPVHPRLIWPEAVVRGVSSALRQQQTRTTVRRNYSIPATEEEK